MEKWRKQRKCRRVRAKNGILFSETEFIDILNEQTLKLSHKFDSAEVGIGRVVVKHIKKRGIYFSSKDFFKIEQKPFVSV